MDLNSMDQTQAPEEFPAEEKARIDAKVREHEKLVNIVGKVSTGLDLAAALLFLLGFVLIELSLKGVPPILGYALLIVSVVLESIQIFGTLIFNCVIDMITKLGTKTWIESSGADAKGYLARFGTAKPDLTVKKRFSYRSRIDLLENFKLATLMTEKPNEKTVTLVCCVLNIICGAAVGAFSVLFSIVIITMSNSTIMSALEAGWFFLVPFIAALLIAIVNLVLQSLQRSRVKTYVEELRRSVAPKAVPQAETTTAEKTEVVQADTTESIEVTTSEQDKQE